MRKRRWIHAHSVEREALEQFNSAMEQDFSVMGALMPDAHTGYTLPIGAVIATKNRVLPSWVGYDIGCGVCAIKTEFSLSQVERRKNEIFQEIYRQVPTGFKHNRHNSDWDYNRYDRTSILDKIFAKNGLKQLGSLGSGNHFIEIGQDEGEAIWIVVHSGSRGIGHATATHYMKVASGDGKAREGHFGFEATSTEGRAYIKDMGFCLEFALENRRKIVERVFRILHQNIQSNTSPSPNLDKMINRTHNHAEMRDGLWIHRKGATQAEKGMLGIIPGNMRDGSFIVKGLGDPTSLWSSSHGAGRVMGRNRAKKSLSLEEFRQSMMGIKANVAHATLDESPFAYKDIWGVMERQKTMATILHHIKPIINIKA